MREIVLTNPKYKVLVDDEDYEILTQWKWSTSTTKAKHIYARRTQRTGPKDKNGKGPGMTIFLHRFVMKADKTQYVDHIDGNTFNNQKSNLRICTGSENNYNQQGHTKQRRSKYKGVIVSTRNNISAKITANKKVYKLGSFATQEEAAQAYNQAAIMLHGPFASLNVIGDSNE